MPHFNKLFIPILFVNLLFCISISAQNDYYNRLQELTNTSASGADARFKHVLRTEFSQLTNANANGIIGNYVGLSTKDKTLSFAYNFIREKSILELNFSGGINDNIAGVFAEDKLKSNARIGFKYNRVFGINKLALNHTQVRAISEELKTLHDAHSLSVNKYTIELEKLQKDLSKKIQDSLALDKKYKLIFVGQKDLPIDVIKDATLKLQKSIIESEIVLLEKKKANFESFKNSRISALKKKRDDVSNVSPYKLEQFRIDRLKVLNTQVELIDSLKLKRSKLTEINKKIKENTIGSNKLERVVNELEVIKMEIKMAKEKLAYFKSQSIIISNNTYEEKRKKTLDKFTKIRAEDIKLYWFSFSGGITSERYKHGSINTTVFYRPLLILYFIWKILIILRHNSVFPNSSKIKTVSLKIPNYLFYHA